MPGGTQLGECDRLAGIEFTSISQRGEEDIRYFVQLYIQGTLRK